MAPIKKRAGMRAKIASKTKPGPSTFMSASTSSSTVHQSQAEGSSAFDDEHDDSGFSSFANSKRDRRIMKHSAFVSKIEKQNQASKKRRRPSKKLQTQLEGLVDALPDIEAQQGAEDDEHDWEGMSEDEETPAATAGVGSKGQDMLGELAKMVNVRKSIKNKNPAMADSGKMKMKTLKSRPGAMKRKNRLETMEMERFKKNLAQMSQPAAVSTTGTAEPKTGDRWAALRGFIGQTMETNPQFGNKTA